MRIGKIAGAITTGACLSVALGMACAPAHAEAQAQAPVRAEAPTTPADTVTVRGASCGVWTGGCSEVQNRSKRNVRVGRDWCGSGDTGDYVKYRPSCSGKSGHNYYKWLNPGRHSYTSAYKDTDTFAIMARCTMRVQWNKDGQENAKVKTYTPRNYDRWFKVGNNYDIDIESYSC